MKKISVVNILITLIVSLSFAQNSIVIEKDTYAKDELTQDFLVFRASLEEGHPSLYQYKNKRTMDSIFNANLAALPDQVTDREFVIILSKIVNQIGDGHLRVVLPKVHKDKLDEGPTALPLTLFWSEGNVYITRNVASEISNDLIGAQVISINGKSLADFLQQYVELISSDGSNVSNKYRSLQRPRIFPRYFNILYGYTEQYVLTYIPFGQGNTKTITLKGITYDEFLEILYKRYPPAPLAEFRPTEVDNYAYLRIRTFDKNQLKEGKINYEKFLQNAFSQIEESGIGNLILDLRGNGGGTDEYGKLLYSYFTDKPFDYYSSLTMNKESFDFFKYTSRPDAKAPKGMLKQNNEGTFDNVKHPNVGKQKPKSPMFAGSIYVLIDGGCFSTTSEFLSVLHYNTKAVFIGEESGGGYYGNCSGPSPEFVLPNTKVSVTMPLMRYNMAVSGYSQVDRGIIPNHIVQPTIKDRLENKDPELELAKRLIKLGRN